MSKAEKIRQALLKLLEKHESDGAIPTSARFLFYELVAGEVIPKKSTGKRRADQDMIDQLMTLRERGQVPWEWIVDETREVEDFTGYSSVKQGLLSTLPYINLDPWQGLAPMVLCESRSLAGALRPICEEYSVKVASTNGQCGGFLRTSIAPKLRKRDLVLYFGDLDKAGGDIEGNTERVLKSLVGPLGWERLALTETQVENDPTLIKIPKIDRRDGKEYEAVECEALSQTVIMEILRSRLEELLPEPLEYVHERARLEQEALAEHIRQFRP